MTQISSPQKLFSKMTKQGYDSGNKNIGKRFLTCLVTASAVALTLSSSGALAGANPVAQGVITGDQAAAFSDQAADNKWFGIKADGTNNGNAAAGPLNGDAFTYGADGVVVTADVADRVIQAININGKTGASLIVNNVTFIGSIGDTAVQQKLPITVSAPLTFTGTAADANNNGFDLNANIYGGVGNITLNGANARLVIDTKAGGGDGGKITLTGTIDGTVGGNNGVLTVNTDTDFTAAIGGNNSLAKVTFNNQGASTAGNIFATKTTIGNAATDLATGAITGAVHFAADGQLTVDGGITGAVTTAGGWFAAGGNLIVKSGNIQDVADANGGVTSVTFNNGDNASTAQNIYAKNVIIGKDGGNNASVVSTKAIMGDVHFTADGQLTVDGGITGAITTENNDEGSLFIEAGDVTGAIGTQNNKLNLVTFNGASTAGNIFATKTTIGNAATDLATDKITGTVHFADNGKLTVNNGIEGDVTTVLNLGDNIGTLIVNGGNVQDVGTENAPLLSVTFNNNTTTDKIFAKTITINTAKNVITEDISGAVHFAADGTLQVFGSITGNVDFVGYKGKLLLDEDENVNGNIFNTGNNVAGTINFAGNNTVTKNIGLNADGQAGSAVTLININGANGTNVALQGDVNTTDLKFTNAGAAGTVQIGKNLTGNVEFGNNANGGILEFNGKFVNVLYIFNGTVTNPNNGTLNVNTKLIATKASVGTINTINIGNNNAALVLDASEADVTLLTAGQTINFGNADSLLGFTNIINRNNAQIIFENDLAAAPNNGGGKLFFMGSVVDDNAGNALTITSNDGNVRNIGAAGNKFTSLDILDKVIVTDKIDLSGINKLNVVHGADFIDQGVTSAAIPEINIGAAFDVEDIDEGPASYTIDANGGNVNILENGKTINFLHDDATLVLQDSGNNDRTITLNADLNPGALGKGIVTLNSAIAGKTLSIISANGSTLGTDVNKLKQVVFRGEGKINTKAIAINTNNILLDIAAIELGAINSNLSFGRATTLTQTGDIAGYVDFNGHDATITLNANKNINGDVISTGGTNGTIIFTGTGSVGGKVNNINMFKAGAGDVSIKTGGNITIGEIQGNGTGTLTLPENFSLTGAINRTGGETLKLNFTNGGSVSGTVGAGGVVGNITTAGTTKFASAVTAQGNMKFSGNTSFDNTFTNTGDISASGTTTHAGAFTNIGKLNLAGTTGFADTFNNKGPVILAPNSVNNFAKDVTATSIDATDAIVNYTNSLAFNSELTGSGTTVNLNTGTVTYTGDASFTGKLILNTTYNDASSSGGNIFITEGSTFDISQVSEVEVLISGMTPNSDQIGAKYNIILAETADGLVPTDKDKVTVRLNMPGLNNPRVNFTLNNKTLSVPLEDTLAEIIEEEVKPGGALASASDNEKKVLTALSLAAPGTDARETIDDWAYKLNSEQIADASSRLIEDSERPSDSVANIVTQAVTGNIASNLASLNTRMDNVQKANQGKVAIAAGDEDAETKFGVWGSPFVGNATQKMRNNVNGYKATSNGGTVGFDSLINDNLVLGFAYTRADTKIKLKNTKVGDQSKVKSNIYSLYGLYNLPTSDWFLEGIVSYSDSKIKSYSKRIIALAENITGNQTALGKYKSNAYIGQVMAGYSYLTPQNINLTPMVGFKYSNINDKGYKETGTTTQNLIVKGKSYNTFDGLAGVKVSHSISTGEITYTPELYGMIDYGFKNKAPAVDARLQGMNESLPSVSFKPAKTSFNFGAGITAKYRMMEYGLNYDANVTTKYFGQQGSLKIRVNF